MGALYAFNGAGQDLTNAVTTKVETWCFPPWAQRIIYGDLNLILHGEGWQNVAYFLEGKLFTPMHVAIMADHAQSVLWNISSLAQWNDVMTTPRMWASVSSMSPLQGRWGKGQVSALRNSTWMQNAPFLCSAVEERPQFPPCRGLHPRLLQGFDGVRKTVFPQGYLTLRLQLFMWCTGRVTSLDFFWAFPAAVAVCGSWEGSWMMWLGGGEDATASRWVSTPSLPLQLPLARIKVMIYTKWKAWRLPDGHQSILTIQ